MINRETEYFSLEQICRSGQCFRMRLEADGMYHVIAGNRYLKIRQQGRTCSFSCDEAEFEEFWREYFDLDGDYGGYLSRIDPGDAYLMDAAVFGSGVRILKQDLWEMIVSFLISQQNNIVRIRRCIGNLCETYGEKLVNGDGVSYYGFPRPEALAGLGEDDLKACNLGYRSRYVVRAAKRVVSGETDLDAVGRMSFQEAKEELLKFYGVGDKVADCICLFALHHLQAFPVDTHIRQALDAHYKNGFPHDRYEGVQGAIQQYIFYYELCGKQKQDI